MNIRKTGCILFSALLLTVAFSGCHDADEYTPALPESTSTPPVKTEDEGAEATFTAELYFVSEDGRKLYSEERELAYGSSVTRAYAAVEALIEGPQSPSLQSSVPEGLNLEHVELSMNICNVYLTGIFPDVIDDWLTARVAIAATVNSAEGSEAVNVFYNGAEPGYEGRPLGEARPITEALDVYLNNMEQSYVVLLSQQQGEAIAYETHNATMYFSNSERKLIAASSVELSYPMNTTDAELVALLINKLRAGDSSGEGLEPVLSADFLLASEAEFLYYSDEEPAPTVTPSPSGSEETPEPTATQNASEYDPPLPQGAENNYILEIAVKSDEEYDVELACAALTMTLTGYIPKIDGVRISVATENGMEPLCESYFVRDDFRSIIGDDITLVYPDSDGASLLRVERIVSFDKANTPLNRLEELFDGPADPGVMYDAFTAEDIIEVYVNNGTAVVNWKAGFKEKLMDMIENDSGAIPAERREVMFIYGVINTLAEMPYIRNVWMIENGEKIGGIKEVYLGCPLAASPGLISAD